MIKLFTSNGDKIIMPTKAKIMFILNATFNENIKF